MARAGCGATAPCAGQSGPPIHAGPTSCGTSPCRTWFHLISRFWRYALRRGTKLTGRRCGVCVCGAGCARQSWYDTSTCAPRPSKTRRAQTHAGAGVERRRGGSAGQASASGDKAVAARALGPVLDPLLHEAPRPHSSAGVSLHAAAAYWESPSQNARRSMTPDVRTSRSGASRHSPCILPLYMQGKHGYGHSALRLAARRQVMVSHAPPPPACAYQRPPPSARDVGALGVLP